MDTLFQDLRYAVRQSMRAPGFMAVAVLALALGIGANTAIFTVVNAVLIERLPYRDADRLVVVWETSARRPGGRNTIAPANFLRWRERATAFAQMSAFYDYTVNLTGAGEPEQLVVQAVTPDFFSTLGVTPVLGRAFAPDEGPRGRDDVAILGYPLWQRRFGGDPDIVGRSIQLNGRSTTIVGVMALDTGLFLKNGSLVGKPAEIWQPFAFTEAQRQPHGRYLTAIARLKPDATFGEAQTQMTTIATALAGEWVEFDTGWGVHLSPIRDDLSGDLQRPLLILTGAVAFVLLIACANVANLLLARGAARQREIAIRTALGAARRRLVRQLLTESLVLGLLGGAAGLLVAQWGLDFLLAISPVDLAGLRRVRISYSVLAFTATVSILTAVIAGFAPAFEGSRTDVQESLKDGARQAGTTRRHRRLRHGFVIAEIAPAVALLAGAGLMLRSLSALRAVDPGFDAHNVLTMRVAVPTAKYSDDARRIQFFSEAVSRLRALPGVEAAGAISFLPFAGLGAGTGFTIVGQPPPPAGQRPTVDVRVCDNGYFKTMSIPLVAGRLFTEHEMRERSDVVVINATLARQYFPGESPLGKRIVIAMTDPTVPTEIIGVVGDVRHADLVAALRSTSYWPHPQLAYGAMTFTLRTASDPLAVAAAAGRTVQSIDKDQPVSDIRTMDQWLGKSLAQARFNSILLSVFAGVALLLSAIGIYGVMSYAVSQRTPEIGIRLALGADRRQIVRLIVANGIQLAVAGLAIGVGLALILSRTMTALLYETSGTDPVTFAGVVVVLGAVAVLATYLPARRASRIAPVEALRSQ